MLTNFPATGTAGIFTNAIVASAIKRVNGSFIVRSLTQAEQVNRNVESAFSQGSTVDIKVKPALLGQKLVDMDGNLTPKSMAFGIQPVTMDYIYGESLEITPQDLVAAKNGEVDAMAEAVEAVVDGTMKRYESDMINNLRTASLGTALGNGANKVITYDTLSKVRSEFSLRGFPRSMKIEAIAHPTYFTQIANLSEVISSENRLGISGLGTPMITIPSLNMVIHESADYTVSAAPSDPILTAWISGHALAPIRTQGIVDQSATDQRIVRDTITSANVPVLLSISTERQAGAKKIIVDASILSGFKFITPQVTEAGAVQHQAGVQLIGTIA